MKVDEAKYSIAEILNWMRSKELVANSNYQRGGGLWPNAARSYFIDTILRGFPFPKVYFYESVDKETKKPKREIVDGQQRLTTILDFVDGKFALGANARDFNGLKFAELPEETQDTFQAYAVAVDVIRNANRTEILQMFRRMNAFTLPLNAAEKRHCDYFGVFKDWINIFLDRHGSLLVDWKVLTSRQIVRMADAEFVAELVLALEEGIVSTGPAKLNALYKRYDEAFPKEGEYQEKLSEVFSTISTELSELQQTHIVKPHVFHSLACALLHNRYGIPNGQELTGLAPTGAFLANRESAVISLRKLAAAHEEKDMSHFSEYVNAASEGGNRANQRAERTKWLCRALRGEFA